MNECDVRISDWPERRKHHFYGKPVTGNTILFYQENGKPMRFDNVDEPE